MKKGNTKNLKKERGITLVALIVTIVVLLILAGVSINMVLGNNGLIAKAKDAKEKTEQDAVNTEKAMNNLYDEMMSILGNGSGNGSGEGEGDTVDLTGLAIGDLVNYTYDTTDSEGNALTYSLPGTQSGYNDQTVAQSSTTLQWKVLNIDEENGSIDLVSSVPADSEVYLKGVLGCNNGVYLLNDMCAKLYSNSSLGITARSINLEDTEKHLTPTGLSARNNYKNNYEIQYGTTKTYTRNLKYPKLYNTQKGLGIDLIEGETVTQPILDGTILDPYNESSNGYDAVTADTFETASNSLTVTQTAYNISLDEINYGKVGEILYTMNNWYWLASRSVETYSGIVFGENAGFGLRRFGLYMENPSLFMANGNGNSNFSGCLRPIVSLDITLLNGTKDERGAWNLKSDI